MDSVDAEIEQAARTLHLPTIRDGYEEAVEHALRERSTYKQFLADLLGTEVAHRDERRKLRLVREANFARPKRIEDFDYSANPDVLAEQINTLCDPAWVVAGQPLCLIGDSGTGKSHLLIGIGTAIAEAGYKVRYATAANLVNELAEAADERQLTKVIARYGRADLLCLDEFGYLELDKVGAKLLFQIFTEREERRAIAIASNAPFSEWQRTFTDARLCKAIVDRLTFNAHIIETGTESFRLLTTTSQRRKK
jgi:DNA replication protein DnaC